MTTITFKETNVKQSFQPTARKGVDRLLLDKYGIIDRPAYLQRKGDLITKAKQRHGAIKLRNIIEAVDVPSAEEWADFYDVDVEEVRGHYRDMRSTPFMM